MDSKKLTESPWKAAEDIQHFLGLDLEITRTNFFWSNSKGFYCLKETAQNGKEKKWCLHGGKGRKHPDLKPDTEKKLRDFFKPYNAKFFELVGQTFPWR